MTGVQAIPDSALWMVRAERGGIYADYFVREGVISIGWGDLGPLDSSDTNDDIRRRCAAAYPGDINGWSQVRRFARELEVGDGVVTYDNGKRIYHVGLIRTASKHGPLAQGSEYPGYSRLVDWVGNVSRDDLSTNARNSLGGQLTVFRLSESASQELRRLCSKEKECVAQVGRAQTPSPRTETDDTLETAETDILREYVARSGQFVEDAIARLDPYQLQDLVAGILRAMGYRTRVSSPGPDRGVDIFASPDGLGLTEPRIFVEVKRLRAAVGAPALRSFIGGRRTGDRCLYISTGGFSAEARYEADRSQIPLTLIEMPDLRELLVDNYEMLDPATRALVPLRKVYWPTGD